MNEYYWGGFMRRLSMCRRSLLLILFTVAIAWPATAFGQGRGRGTGRGIGVDRKPDIFINGHDARDGRWDGRGPQVQRRNILIDSRGRGRRIGLSRKSRFVNGHDARDGRFDGRGPWLRLRHRHRHLNRSRFFR